MSYNTNYEELVGKYLDGEMSDVEKLDFENQLVNNDALKEEYQLQQKVIEEVQETRKAELKARLDNVKVPTSNFYQYVGLKTAAIITISTMIGFGAFYYFQEADQSGIASKIDLNEQHIVEIEAHKIPEKPVPEIALEEADPTTDVLEGRKKPLSPQPSVTPEDEDSKRKENIAKSSPKINTPEPEIVRPDSDIDFGEELEQNDEPFESVGGASDAINKAKAEKVEVETISDKKKDFHYQFYNNKLYLYGRFDEMPYEIIEFNVDNEKLYYLFYDSTYYQLDNNQAKISPLKKLSDEDLINELDLIRSRK